MNRRRAIALLGSAAALTSCRRPSQLLTFSSIAFGTEVQFHTYGISEASFREISEECSLRLRFIESLFSLYDSESAISRLNLSGKLESPHPEFLRLLRHALDIGKDTSGLFDITVQPLWDWRTKWKEGDLLAREAMRASWEETLALVDYRNLIAGEKIVSFSKTGMAVTLNGIVQGYATDEILALLKKKGIRNALVNIGEYAAHGLAPDGKQWNIELAASGENFPLPPGSALAVSSGSGYTFDPAGTFHHIFRPGDGGNPRPKSTVIVTAPTATTADALSTALSVASAAQRQAILNQFPHINFREIEV